MGALDGMDQQLLVSGRVTLCYLASANVADCLDLASLWFSLVGRMDGWLVGLPWMVVMMAMVVVVVVDDVAVIRLIRITIILMMVMLVVVVYGHCLWL